ncbi:hypothetical protein D3C76_1103180 [compost metagenome]
MPSARIGAGQCSEGARSSAAVTGRRKRSAAASPSSSRRLAPSSATGIDRRLATRPQRVPPAAMLPKNTRMYTASARARTQPGTEVCAATCRLDSTAIQAAPLSSITGTSR